MEESPLIGICDGAIDQKKNTYYNINKIGGCPDLIPGVSNPLNLCTLCSGVLSHVVQIYCPLAVSPYHRTINVFACTAPQCHGKQESWKAVRSQCLEFEIKETSACQSSDRTPVSTTDWCDDADDWGMDSEENTDSEQTCKAQPETGHQKASLDVSSRLQDLCINGSAGVEAAGPPTDSPTFQSYISVMDEADLVGQNDLEHANRLLKEYEEREGVAVREIACCEGQGGEEAYEKAKAKHGDAAFSSFMKRVSLCPEQVLRYSWSGTPLFIMAPPSNVNQMVPPCAHCGSPRVFEFQLMPALVSLLRSVHLSSELAVEFGTVLIYTCRNSCWTSGSSSPLEEFHFVQTDPDQKLFK
ncbi:programmed cell death protein 2-like [Neoarius graeffei]|uniref:programmed cell death protein 2-like n=1 Tax=Neoarius graeffei TaxID=443677 RepID=UPI00298CD1FC|nr:programmed cell death protein 2-like [Neoarius graeffei]